MDEDPSLLTVPNVANEPALIVLYSRGKKSVHEQEKVNFQKVR